MDDASVKLLNAGRPVQPRRALCGDGYDCAAFGRLGSSWAPASFSAALRCLWRGARIRRVPMHLFRWGLLAVAMPASQSLMLLQLWLDGDVSRLSGNHQGWRIMC